MEWGDRSGGASATDAPLFVAARHGDDRLVAVMLRRLPSDGRERLAVMTAALSVCLLPLAAARAQTPFVPDEWRFGKRQESSTLRYCIDARDPDLPVARKIAAAVADALLLQPQGTRDRRDPTTTDMSGEDLDDHYRMSDPALRCVLRLQAVAGRLSGLGHHHAALLPRPICICRAIRPGVAGRHADQPRAIGATIGTAADLRLIAVSAGARAPAERWDKFPDGVGRGGTAKRC